MTIQVRKDAEPIEIEADAYLPTEFGNFRVRVTLDSNGKEHALLYTGDISNGDAPLVRIHSECLTGDAFGSMKCDCGPQLGRDEENPGRRMRGSSVSQTRRKRHRSTLKDTGLCPTRHRIRYSRC